MLATNGPRWYDQRSESNWSSFGVSIAITIGIFAAAIMSMRTVSTWLEPRLTARETPTIVELQPPIVAPKPVAKPVVRPERVAPSVAAPTVTPKTIDIAPPVAAPVTMPTTIAPVTPRDSSANKSTAPAIPLGPVRRPYSTDTLVSNLRGADVPIAAGVTHIEAVPNTAHARDSIAASMMASAKDWLTDKYKPKGAELAALQAGKREAERMMQRTTTAGTQDIHVPVGEGLGGVGAVGGGKTGYHDGMVSIPFPLLSPGPSPAERKRNEKLVAEYQGYLHRMDDRIVLRADSVRADSLRRDSIAKARARIVP